jgi:hypothetical protein
MTLACHLLCSLLREQQSVRGQDARLLMTKWPGKMIEREDNFLKIEDTWNVLLITKFAPEDYEGFLKDEVPLELCQRILVRNGPCS